jgi:MFS superfamily sulfate permease-like transporter
MRPPPSNFWTGPAGKPIRAIALVFGVLTTPIVLGWAWWFLRAPSWEGADRFLSAATFPMMLFLVAFRGR